MEPSFEKLLVLLAKAGVNFIVVGGVAVAMQGYVRLTDDVDLLVDDRPANVRRLLEALADYGEGSARGLAVDDFTDVERAIRIVEEIEQCQIDLFTRLSGRRYLDVIGDADRFEVRGCQIYVASKDSLIGWKGKSEIAQDQLDALALRRLQENPAGFD